MARRSCGSVLVRTSEQDGSRRDSGSEDDPAPGETPDGGPPPELPGIGPLSADNPRALGAGAATIGIGALLLGR